MPCATNIGAFTVISVRIEDVVACAGPASATITSLSGVLGDDGAFEQLLRRPRPNSSLDRTWLGLVWSTEVDGLSQLEMNLRRKIRSQKDYFLAIVE